MMQKNMLNKQMSFKCGRINPTTSTLSGYYRARLCTDMCRGGKKGSYLWARPLEMDKSKPNKLTPIAQQQSYF